VLNRDIVRGDGTAEGAVAPAGEVDGAGTRIDD
jgi:hypothetical protein